MAICRKKYNKLYYEIHKDKYKERYERDKVKIAERNAERKEQKSEYDHIRNLKNWDKKAEYNREYYRRRKCKS